MLKKFQDMGKLLKQAKEMKSAMATVQQELKKEEIEVSGLGGKLTVKLNGELEVISVDIDSSLLQSDQKEPLQKGLVTAFSQAIKNAKNLAASKLASISGGLIPGA